MKLWNRLRGTLPRRIATDAAAWLERAERAIAAGQRDEAHAALTAALDQQALTATLAVGIGRGLAKIDDIKGAARAYARAYELDPTLPDAAGLLGLTLVDLGEVDEGLKHLREAVRLTPDVSDAHLRLASTLIAHGHADEGINHLRRAAELDPQSSEIHAQLGRALCEAGHCADAVVVLRRAIALSPTDQELKIALGISLSRSGATSEAIAVFEQIRRSTSDASRLALVNLGLALQSAGDLSAAEGYLREAVSLTPDAVQARVALGINFLEQGSVASAVTELTRATEIDPDSAEAHYQLGLALEGQGDLSAAETVLARAAELAPQDERITNKLKWLRDEARAAALVRAMAPSATTGSAAGAASAASNSKRPTGGAAFEGTLETFGVPDLLEFLKNGRRTGVLHLTIEGAVGEVRLLEGKLVGAGSPAAVRICDLLQEQGSVDEDDIAELLKVTTVVGDEREVIEAARAKGLVGDDVLAKLVAQKVRSAVREMIDWERGTFVFEPLRTMATTGLSPLDVGQVLLDVFREIEDAAEEAAWIDPSLLS